MWRVAIALVALLIGCSESDKKTVLEVVGHIDVVADLTKVVTVSDTLFVSDVLSIEGAREPSFAEYECTEGTCTRSSVQPLFEPISTVGQLATAVADPRNERSDIRKYRGIGLAEYNVARSGQGVAWTFSHYGGWLDYSGFETSIASGVRESHVRLTTAYSLSFGKRSGTDPAGNATWEGVMLGHTRHGAVQPLQGDAMVDFQLDDMTIDVYFSNIQNLDTGNAAPDMQFSDIPVSDGGFATRTPTAHIAGRFYGPDHEEVGGVFTYPTALGAFGSRKR